MKNSLIFTFLCVAVIVPTVVLADASAGMWRNFALAALLLEVVALVVVYRSLFRPMKVISGGMNLLREQDFSSRLRRVGQADADKVVDMFNTMMDQLKVQNLRMQEQNAFMQLLIDASPMGVMIIDDVNRVSSANNAARLMLGDDVEGQALNALESPLAVAVAQLKLGEVRTVRVGGRDVYRCSRLFFMDRGWRHPFVLIEGLTEELRAAEKQALTRVIRTMAHEVNNSMAGILSTIDTISSILASRDDTQSLVSPLKACSDRALAMTGFIRNFAEVVKVPEPDLVLTDFQEVVSPLKPFLEGLCGSYGAGLEIDIDNSAPLRLDIVLMQQALVNIVKNAAESASEGGLVSVRADGTVLTVTDNGPGLTPDAEEHLFTALYTTKPDGQGLGLMLVAEILSRHRADFSLRTPEPGRTVFTMSFKNSRGAL